MQGWSRRQEPAVSRTTGFEPDLLEERPTEAKRSNALSHPDTGPALQQAIATLGLGPLVQHFFAHVRAYIRAEANSMGPSFRVEAGRTGRRIVISKHLGDRQLPQNLLEALLSAAQVPA